MVVDLLRLAFFQYDAEILCVGYVVITEGIFVSVNSEKDKQEERERQKCQRAGVGMYVCTVVKPSHCQCWNSILWSHQSSVARV